MFNRNGAKARRYKLLQGCMLFVCMLVSHCVFAQQQYELNSGWKCAGINDIGNDVNANTLSQVSYPLKGWLPATVPGTVLTTLINNKKVPDPFYGMNNKLIPDIYTAGRPAYTYWFINDFTEQASGANDRVYLELRGVNYNFNVFINGKNVSDGTDKGMYLRQSFDITSFLSKDGHNRLAIIVRPPEPAGNPNGGQGGDGMIAHSVTNQYVAGWDWIQPVADRNTGIWDKVIIKKTKQVNIDNTHVVTLVPGRRTPDGKQKPVAIKVTAEVENTDSMDVDGTLQYEVEGRKVSVKVKLEAHTMQVVEFPPMYVDSPRLWWPNGYGAQNLYELKVKFFINGKTVSDEEKVTFGIRELKAVWNKKTKSRELRVNGQKIFIKGGNWIVSDEMLRYSKERYDAEVHFHRDMNLNLIRVWGGGITERPEFYDACDKYGLLVMQDFWVSGDCNGRWDDSFKADDTTRRRNYPDDHGLFVESFEDQVKMLRNHPSLAYWCGGNEITPPQDILTQIRDSLLPVLDGTRFFFNYSNDDSMSYQSHDGPYSIQHPDSFWTHRSYPFNSEVGSVGIGDVESLERFIPKQNLVAPVYDSKKREWKVDSVWQYHKYRPYDSSIEAYGHPKNIEDFAMKAQLVNYNQYRALMEGFTAHMWDWYTGVIVWKTQNPWTAMTGQMYDVYLDPNACMYGLAEGAKPVHIMYDPVKNNVLIVNNTSQPLMNIDGRVTICHSNGDFIVHKDSFSVPVNSCAIYMDSIDMARLLKRDITLGDTEYARPMLHLSLSADHKLLDENVYWLPDEHGRYYWPFFDTKRDSVAISAVKEGEGKVVVRIKNPYGYDRYLSFFNRVSLVNKRTKKRILPVFYNNNYISVLPGEEASVEITYTPQPGVDMEVTVEGWNLKKQFIEIK